MKSKKKLENSKNIPSAEQLEAKWPAYTMVEDRMKRIYFEFYKETYKKTHIDRKTKELIAIAASLGLHCQGCLEGHLKKALQYGATREEISESIAITMGVAAAAMVDLTDIAAENMQLLLFDPKDKQSGPHTEPRAASIGQARSRKKASSS